MNQRVHIYANTSNLDSKTMFEGCGCEQANSQSELRKHLEKAQHQKEEVSCRPKSGPRHATESLAASKCGKLWNKHQVLECLELPDSTRTYIFCIFFGEHLLHLASLIDP